MMKIDALELKNLKICAWRSLLTFPVTKEMGVLPISPTTTENDNFEGSFASILDIFFFKYLYFKLLDQIFHPICSISPGFP